MKLQVLGCGGGIGGRERATTCLRIDGDILLDAGTGVAALDLEQLLRIEHVFLTHSHLDHVAGLALLLDAVAGKRSRPLTVHASEAVIQALQSHLFNWRLWPDFTQIPSAASPTMRWQPLAADVPQVIDGRSISAHPVNHVVDAVAYWVHNGSKGFLFTGDTAAVPQLWEHFRNEQMLEKVIVDCSFADDEHDVAAKSRHFCPQALIADVHAMPPSIEFLVFHLKPGQEDRIMRELESGDPGRRYSALRSGDTFRF